MIESCDLKPEKKMLLCDRGKYGPVGGPGEEGPPRDGTCFSRGGPRAVNGRFSLLGTVRISRIAKTLRKDSRKANSSVADVLKS